MESPPPPVLAEGICRDFRAARKKDRVHALADFNLTVNEGEVLGLLGPNGSGKSTTIKILLGLLRPTAGSVRVLGRPAGDRKALARVGYLPEETRLFEFLTPLETLKFFGSLAGVERKDRKRVSEELLESVGLAEAARRRIAGFSKGMNRRLGLAAALVGDPELLILDEPTSGLDPLVAARVKERILSLKKSGRTVLLSSHLLSDVENVCDRIVILGRGKVIREGPPEELLALKEEYEVRFRGGGPGFAERVREFVLEGGAETAEVRPAREDLQGLFLRIFGES